MLAVVLAGCERPDVRFPQFVQDDLVTWSILVELDTRLEEELARQTAGQTSFTTACAGHGSMQVSGTLGVDGAADLALELDDCGIDQVDPDGSAACSLTIAGPMTYTYATDHATGFFEEELRSEGLEMTGTVTSQDERRDVSDRCALSVTLTATDVSVALRGQVCGRHTTSSLAHASCGM